jgi:hypothetical protein
MLMHGRLAQLGERRVRNAEVEGSNPLPSTKASSGSRTPLEILLKHYHLVSPQKGGRLAQRESACFTRLLPNENPSVNPQFTEGFSFVSLATGGYVRVGYSPSWAHSWAQLETAPPDAKNGFELARGKAYPPVVVHSLSLLHPYQILRSFPLQCSSSGTLTQ